MRNIDSFAEEAISIIGEDLTRRYRGSSYTASYSIDRAGIMTGEITIIRFGNPVHSEEIMLDFEDLLPDPLGEFSDAELVA